MIYVDSKFSGRAIICGLDSSNIKSFMKSFIKYVWLEHKIPDGMRKVGDGTKLTLEMLPNNINLDDIANKAVDKKILMLERIGSVNLWLELWITQTQGDNPQIKIDIDKFKYEKSGDNLLIVINKTIENFK